MSQHTTKMDEAVTINPTAGECIEGAAARAIAVANHARRNVGFTFNGVVVTVKPDSAIGDVVVRWREDFDKAAEEYRASDEGKRNAARREQDRVAAQDRTDTLIGQIPDAVSDLSKLLPILAGLSESIRTDTRWTPKTICDALESAGYVWDEYVDHKPQSDFDTNPTVIGRYIVGQCIDYLRRGMPPHPVTIGFVESYFKIVALAGG